MNRLRFFDLVLRPVAEADRVGCMDVEITEQAPAKRAGGELFKLGVKTVGIPFCEIPGGITVTDAHGEVEFDVRREVNGFLESDNYITRRDTEGDLRCTYRILPRVQPEDYRSSPYFDFVCEPGGASGAGLTFLPNFGDTLYDFRLNWDLSAMPENARGVWCLAEGDTKAELKGGDICFSYYAVGALNSVTRENFAFYWFADPPFPAREAVEKIQALYLYMADFFRDSKEPYKVFARANNFESDGGTALLRSYMFGYGKNKDYTVDSLLALFAHEMVHNWPHLKDEPYGAATWYAEGMAEYYCTVLPYRAGLYTLEKTLSVLNEKTAKYYSNPTNTLSDGEAAKVFWSDRRTQRIPYGRGFLYIANVDAQLRAATGGKTRVDDIVLEILSRPEGGKSCTNETWLELVSEALGRDAAPEFEEVRSGKPFKPADGCFGGAFRAVPAEFDAEGEDGLKLSGYRWELTGENDSLI